MNNKHIADKAHTGAYHPGALYHAWTPDHDVIQAVAAFLDRYHQEPAYIGPSACGNMLFVGPVPHKGDEAEK